jgi:hypothetical protein
MWIFMVKTWQSYGTKNIATNSIVKLQQTLFACKKKPAGMPASRTYNA